VPAAASSAARRAAARERVDAALHAFVHGAPPGGAGGAMMTARRVAATARDAALAVLAVLDEPRPSAHRVRGLITPVLTCPWAEFDDAYAAALDAIVALPPALPGVEEPAWDAALPAESAPRRSWMERGQHWSPPVSDDIETVAPGGTSGRVARRGSTFVVVTADGRPVRTRAHCACHFADREARPAVPFEHDHLRRDGTVLAVTVGTACGVCRAAVG
jgi:hypothetical protein